MANGDSATTVTGTNNSILLALFSLGVGDGLSEETGAVEVHVRVEKALAHGVHLSGEVLRNMLVTEVFSHDGPVLGFGQTVVVAMPGARLGELDPELVEQLGHGVVDVLRAVVGMKAQDREGEACKDLFQHGQQECLGQALAGGDDFVLGNASSVDVIHPLDAVLIALMHTVDANESGASIGGGCAAHSDRNCAATGLGPVGSGGLVASLMTQVVQGGPPRVWQAAHSGHRHRHHRRAASNIW